MTPNGWRALKLGDTASFEYGRSLPSSQRRGGPVPVCGSNGVVGYHDESLVRGPGIVVGRKGSVGAVAWMGCDFWPIDTTYYVNPTGQTDARWLYYAISNLGLERLNEATGIPGLNRSTATSLHFQLPPIVEQRKIASILASMDDSIEKTLAVIEQVKVVKRGLMQELLTRGLPGRHTHFKQTEIGKIPEQWDVVEMASVASVERGKFAYRPRNEPRFYGGRYPFVQTGDVAACDGFIRTYGQTLNEDGLALSRLFPSGTILLTIAANIGSTGIATFDVAFPDSLVGIQAGPRVDTRFLELVLQDRKRVLDRFAPESAQKNINLNTLRPLKIPLPDMLEQTKIARSVWSVIDLRRSARDHLEGLKLVKSALMSVLLTGELRVTPDPEPE